MWGVLRQTFAVPNSPAPPSGSDSASTLHSRADLACAMQRLPSASDSRRVGGALPAGTGTSGCAACNWLSPPSAEGPLGSSDAARPAAAGGWCTGQPAPGLYWPNCEETSGAGGCSLCPRWSSAVEPWHSGCCLLGSWGWGRHKTTQ